MLHVSFLLFNPAHIRHARSLIKKSGEFVELIRGACGVNLHAPVIFVANPAAQTDADGVLFDEPAESNTLHAAGNIPAAGLCAQVPDPCLRPSWVSKTFSIAWRNAFTVNGLGIR